MYLRMKKKRMENIQNICRLNYVMETIYSNT